VERPSTVSNIQNKPKSVKEIKVQVYEYESETDSDSEDPIPAIEVIHSDASDIVKNMAIQDRELLYNMTRAADNCYYSIVGIISSQILITPQ